MLHLNWLAQVMSIGTNWLVVHNQCPFNLNTHLRWKVVKPASEFIVQPIMNWLQTKRHFLVEYDVGSVVVAISYKANAFLPKVLDPLVLEFQFDLVRSHDNIIYTDFTENFIINERLYKIFFKWSNIVERMENSSQELKNIAFLRQDIMKKNEVLEMVNTHMTINRTDEKWHWTQRRTMTTRRGSARRMCLWARTFLLNWLVSTHTRWGIW